MPLPLTIAMDARWIFSSLSGIGRYTLELARALIQLDTPHRFILLFDQPELAERHGSALGLQDGSRAMSCLFPHGLFSPASQLLLPRTLRSLGVDVYHSTNYMMPLICSAPPARIVTIHDLIPLLFRDHAPRSKKNRLFPVYRQLMHTIARKADAIIAVSDATRR
ncbi:MAG: glycosyltransferase, partial [Kiritimatiellae bacterium]|nr:glycosyltransferase [Kiritimatiellia bacterium]